jgi:predicted metal-binding membrane protein
VIERALRRDRAIVISGLIAITLLAWAYLINLSIRMAGVEMNGSPTMDMPAAQMTMPNMQAWQVDDILFALLMWAIMMVAMMTPSVTPMILTFAGLNRKRHADKTSISATASFLLGYLIVWILFSIGAALLQWGFHSAELLFTGTISVTPFTGGMLLILAGVYQFTPLKYACLSNCRSPLSFLTTEWREGTLGALIMGLRHGIYCLGCCWQLMLLLFVAGVMNLMWVALIAGYVFVEKVAPAGKWLSRVFGLLIIGWGVWSLLQVIGM